MNTEVTLIRKLTAWGLLLVFLFPSALQFEHIFESHKHESCQDFTLHLHEKKVDCSVHDFHFSTFDFSLFSPTFLVVTIPHDAITVGYQRSHVYQISLGFELRGPPMFS